MKEETLKRIFEFLEEKGENRAPFLWKYKNDIPLTEGDLNVKGNFNLFQSNITSLPEGLKVSGFLILRNTNITSLPKDLKVGGDLSLANTKITSLPKGLKVEGDLFIGGTELTKLSDDELREMIKPGYINGNIY